MTEAVASGVAPAATVRPARRSRGPGRPLWSAAVLVLAAAVAAPVVTVVVEATRAGVPDWPAGLVRMVVTTVLLMGGVALGTLVLGTGLAWLVTAHTFPGRDVWVWLLVLPLAMPAYILGFVFLSTFDAAGDVQVWLRDILPWFEVSVRGLGGCIVVMSLSLYPYVYLMARAAFTEQAAGTYDAARVLGAGRRRALRRVLLPLARPSLAAGLALVMMEVLTDFATVQYFGVRTVSLGVYTVWRTNYDFATAVQLSALVLMFAVAVLAAERLLRGRARFTQHGRGNGLVREPLRGLKGVLATLACVAALAVGVVVPLLQLAWWAVSTLRREGWASVDPRFGEYLINSLMVALLAALACVAFAVVVSHAQRMGGGSLVRTGAQVTTFGYAVPGAVVGIGVLLLLTQLDSGLRALGVSGGTGLLATGSIPAILYAYAVRFVGPAYQAVDASFAKLPASVTQSAMVLGCSPRQVLTRVHLPLVRPGLAVALVLVAVDAVKELPLVLMLRPFGFTTVSVWVYELASENLWRLAALPALVIVGLATVPVALLFRQVRAEDRARRGEG
ncbi:iron ABC transporter permease [Nocardioides rotundus]|uniref:ABC transporter permease n=1 Tax=Nocardioides rotundus TaxID=1774216 RepID=UPI001CC033F1|nr:iron ABC transporter permease [Nocardioides rotundus]UAL28510.1 iron ABC transporter permease [Nocardioides rotundus]